MSEFLAAWALLDLLFALESLLNLLLLVGGAAWPLRPDAPAQAEDASEADAALAA